MPTAEQPLERRDGQDQQAYIKERNNTITSAIERAKAMNVRLRLMKERNENYLAERAQEMDEDEL